MIENDNINNRNNKEEEIDIRKIFYLIMRHWYWFVIFGLIGLFTAYGLNKITKTRYSVTTSILVPEKTQGIDMKSLFQGAFNQQSTNIYNQMELIRSYYNVNQTLSNLNWRTSWYKKDWIVWHSIYGQEPFEVVETEYFNNPCNIPIKIKPIPNDRYIVSVDGTVILDNGQKKEIQFKEEGQFDRPFQNSNLKFTLRKKDNFTIDINDDEIYYFTFNNLISQTKGYQKRLVASLKDKNSDIILCTIEGEDPVRQSEFLNHVIQVYIENKLSFSNESQKRSLEFINNQLSGISDSLNISSNKFTDFRSSNNIINLSSQGELVLKTLKELETENSINEMQLDYYKNLLNYLQTNGDLKQFVSPSVVGIQDASINSLVLKLSELYNRRQILSFSAKENNPTMVRIEKEINQIKNQLNENLKNLIENTTSIISLQKNRQLSLDAQLNKLPKKEQQFINIQRQFDLTNEIYTFLLQKKAEINIAIASSLPDVQVIDVARPETAVVIGLNKKIILAFGLFIGLMLPGIYLLLVNFFDDKIRTQEDVEKNTSIPILGNIMHNIDQTDLTVFEKPKSNIAESFRDFRTNMQFMLNEPHRKVISIHSTSPSEGKSFISTNLATILAMNNLKVLLIGADLRKPRLHKVFNIKNDKGLSTYLIDYNELDEIIIPTKIKNLMLLPSGPIPPNPAELLGNSKFKTLIEELCKNFDYIIIDNAPVGLVTDGVIVGSLCDINIFILRYGKTHKHQLQLINQYNEQNKINNMAIVVNDIKTNTFGYTYYKYYQYEAYQKNYSTYEIGDDKKKKRVKKTKQKA